ncbi:condensation domain-containing protein [Bradyrhizobium sp. SZCCHNS1012]|uniref:condensation domain-containing protein n=1 Tax=Bradyrhizobium sp. SZCCHNS1012 TaxID=3057297 RepID=UPI002915C70F|nr:condensation domain-containing protein [Bradyrhizobium sp. SZCCHNS1012]
MEQEYHCEVSLALLGRGEVTITELSKSLKAMIGRQNANPLLHVTLPDRLETENIKHTADEIPSLPCIIHRPEERYVPFPLTDIQEAFLAGRSLAGEVGDRVGAHVYLELEVKGELDIYRLSKAWQRVIARHDMLRMVVRPDGDQIIQKHTPSYWINILDHCKSLPEEHVVHIEAIRKDMEKRVYRPEHWPLFDIRVSLHPSNRCVVHVSIDELIVDAVSLRVLLRDWGRFYEDPEAALPELTVSFRDYVLALKTFEGTARYKRDMAYWLESLREMPRGPSLALRKTRTNGKIDFGRTRLTSMLPAQHWSVLKAKADGLGVSPTILLLSIFAEVLRTRSTSESFSLVLTFFNRLPLHPQIGDIVGPVISTNIFVVEARGVGNFEQVAQAHQRRLWRDLDHASVSGVRVLRELKARRKLSASFALPVVFTSLLNTGAVEPEAKPLGDLTYVVNQTPQEFLDHQVNERDGCLLFSWDVASGCYATGLMDELFATYCRVLEALASGTLPWHFDSFAVSTSTLTGNLTPTSNPSPSDCVPTGFALMERGDLHVPFPLTDQQMAYAFGRSRHMAGGGNSCQVYQEIEARSLDTGRFAAAWATLLHRHPMLRTVVGSDGSQRTLEAVPEYQIRTEDMRRLPAPEQKSALAAVRRTMMARVAALDEWPYFEVRISWVDDDLSRIHICLDMIVMDSRSIGLVLSQLLRLYQCPANKLETSTITFRDYQLAVESFKKTAAYAASMRYWKHKFARLPTGPRLPELPGKVPDGIGHRRISGVLAGWDALKAQASSLGVAPNAVLLAAYLEILFEWNEREPLTVVVPSWQRLPVHPQIDNIVGDFTALGWVTRSDETLPFIRRIEAIEQELINDLAQRPVSGVSVLRRVALKDSSRRLTFPVVFTNTDARSIDVPPTTFVFIEGASKTPHVYLDNVSIEIDGQLHCSWDCADGVYAPTMVQEMFDGYMRVLALLAREPDAWTRTDFTQVVNSHSDAFGNNANPVSPPVASSLPISTGTNPGLSMAAPSKEPGRDYGGCSSNHQTVQPPGEPEDNCGTGGGPAQPAPPRGDDLPEAEPARRHYEPV